MGVDTGYPKRSVRRWLMLSGCRLHVKLKALDAPKTTSCGWVAMPANNPFSLVCEGETLNLSQQKGLLAFWARGFSEGLSHCGTDFLLAAAALKGDFPFEWRGSRGIETSVIKLPVWNEHLQRDIAGFDLGQELMRDGRNGSDAGSHAAYRLFEEIADDSAISKVLVARPFGFEQGLEDQALGFAGEGVSIFSR